MTTPLIPVPAGTIATFYPNGAIGFTNPAYPGTVRTINYSNLPSQTFVYLARPNLPIPTGTANVQPAENLFSGGGIASASFGVNSQGQLTAAPAFNSAQQAAPAFNSAQQAAPAFNSAQQAAPAFNSALQAVPTFNSGLPTPDPVTAILRQCLVSTNQGIDVNQSPQCQQALAATITQAPYNLGNCLVTNNQGKFTVNQSVQCTQLMASILAGTQNTQNVTAAPAFLSTTSSAPNFLSTTSPTSTFLSTTRPAPAFLSSSARIYELPCRYKSHGRHKKLR